jgi:hypothetical protein
MWHIGCNVRAITPASLKIGLEPDEPDQKRRSVQLRLCWSAALTVLFSLFLLPQAARAQVTATLTGTVQDQSGGVIPNARVTLTNDATKESR